MIFERYETGQHRDWTLKGILIFASIILHALLAVGLIIWSFVHVEEVAPPPLTVTFFSAAAPPPPPPPPPPPAGKKNPTPRPKTPIVQPQKDVQPLVQPKEPEKEPEDEGDDDDGVEGGVEGGVAGGVVGGVVGVTLGGVIGGTGPAQPPPPPPKPKNVPPHQLDNEVLYKPDPHLPDVVKAQRGKGTAVFTAKVCIDQSGKVFQINVLQGIAGADESIKATISEWKYKPQAIPVCFIANWQFDIQ